MSFPKILFLFAFVMFGAIAAVAVFKKAKGQEQSVHYVASTEPIEIELELHPVAVHAKEDSKAAVVPNPAPIETKQMKPPLEASNFVEVDRIEEFFNKREPRLPIVQTITYKSQVPWQKGRPAWVADYASHYKTSRHFIARSLNGKIDYEKQDVSDGVRFNVFNDEKKFEFFLLADLQTRKMHFYYLDSDSGEKVLLKSYVIGVGRPDPSSPSGSLTPVGKFSLGDKVAVYKAKTMGFYQGEKTEMVRIFGTRWIPFGDEIEGCSSSARGFGIHGLPLLAKGNGELEENSASLGEFESDGCIRLSTKDIEELFSIIITKPTTIEIVNGFQQSQP